MTKTASNTTIGLTVGKLIGNAAAYSVHGAVRAAEATGRFGADVAAGATAQYGVKSEELAARREQMREELKARAQAGLADIASLALASEPVAAVAIKAPRTTKAKARA